MSAITVTVVGAAISVSVAAQNPAVSIVGQQGPAGPDLVADRAAIQVMYNQVVADTSQVSLDRQQTGSDRTQTGADVVAANAARDTSVAQASLAAGYAASAGSVAQQDLSGVTAVALHRSPNAVVAFAIYDTSKDSKPEWPAQVDASYLYRTLNGKWLGWCANEAAARAVSGATTNDYYGNTTDGKCYKLSAGAGQVETFDGNTARFPRMPALAAEGTRVILFDALSPGRPMWMSFDTRSGTASFFQVASPAITSLVMGQGSLVVGTSTQGLFVFDFAKDVAWNYRTNGLWRANATLAQRNTAAVWSLVDSTKAIPSQQVNAVAMTTLPDAPVDPVTGLQVPTIAVGTAGGASVIKHDGSVVSSGVAANYKQVTLTKRGDVILGNGNLSGNINYARNVGTLGASFPVGTYTWPSALAPSNLTCVGLASGPGSSLGIGYTPMLSLTRENPVTPAAGLVANIAPAYNTGWMVGDIRRCLFSDVSAGVASGTNQVPNGTFDTDIAGWSANIPSGGTVAWQAGGFMRATAPAAAFSGGYRDIPTVAGNTYTLTPTWSVVTAGGATGVNVFDGGSFGTLIASATVSGTPIPFVAKSASTRVYGYASNSGVTDFDVILVTDTVADRSYKAKNAAINGTLTKTQVASAAQLVFWGGWSATNYAQEAYSADYDVGTGGFALLPWINLPAFANAPGGVAPMTGLPYQPGALSACFPDISAERITNGDMSSAVGWTVNAGWAIAGGVAQHTPGNTAVLSQTVAASNLCRVILTVAGMTAGSLQVGGGTVQGAGTIITANGTYTFLIQPNGPGINLTPSSTFDGSVDNVSWKDIGPAVLKDRSSASGGANWQFGIDAMGRLTGSVSDGTTTRAVTTVASYGGAGALLPELTLSTSGALTIKVNGELAAQTTGAPLLTLNNATAVTTWGNRRTLDAPFPGGIALARFGATVPTDDQSRFIYQQERAMFRDGAQVTLPDAGALVDMDYDPVLDRWRVASAANEAEFCGLVRTATTSVVAGSISKIAGKSGIKLVARTTTTPGVDITMPSQNLKEELLKRAEEAARLARPTSRLDWAGGFTATTVVGSALLTSVANLVVPAGCTVKGAAVTGTGVPAGTTILDFSGTTIQLSAAITSGAGSGVAINLLSFPLPTGMELVAPRVGGTEKQEGSTKDFTRTFNGFREAPLWPTGSPPGNTAWVQTEVRRAAS